MSKDTPEVGDVFQSVIDTDIRVCIIDKYKNGYGILISDKREIWDIKEWIYWKDDYTYLGKSKANIEDLFKTENEE